MQAPALLVNPFSGQLDFVGAAGTTGGVPYPGGVNQWIPVSTTSVALLPNKGYVIGPPSLCTLTLPTTIAFGDVIRIAGITGGWIIAQNANQLIILGDDVSTVGVGGSLSSTNNHDTVELLCIAANLNFLVISGPQGNLTIV